MLLLYTCSHCRHKLKWGSNSFVMLFCRVRQPNVSNCVLHLLYGIILLVQPIIFGRLRRQGQIIVLHVFQGIPWTYSAKQKREVEISNLYNSRCFILNFYIKTIRWNPNVKCFFHRNGTEHKTVSNNQEILKRMKPCILEISFSLPIIFFGVVIAIFAAVSNEVPCRLYQG